MWPFSLTKANEPAILVGQEQKAMHTILIADDHPVFRRGLREVVEESQRFRVISEVGDGRAALDKIRELRPAAAVLDIEMPELDGLEVLKQAQGWPSAPRFVVLSMHNSYVKEALEAGASGYVLKENAVDEVTECLITVMSGRRYVGQGTGMELKGKESRPADPLSTLTPTERRIVKLVGEVKTSREIADILCVSLRTVQNHRARACSKLGLEGSQALLRFALSLNPQEEQKTE